MTINYTEYIDDLNTQRKRFPTRQKLYPYSPLTTIPLNSLKEILLELTNEAYNYTGLVKSKESQYNIEAELSYIEATFPLKEGEIDERFNNLYYEFVLPSGGILDTLRYWKYIYIPVTNRTKHFLAGKEKLPYTLHWEVLSDGRLSNSKLYPYKENLKDIDISYWVFNYDVNQGSIHPFLPGFVFNNRVVEQSDGSLLYEYQDTKGHYGVQESTYISGLRPNGLDLPLGIPAVIHMKACDIPLIGQSPSIGDMNKVGEFTGYTSDPNYYIYKREDESVFITRDKPHPDAREAINLARALDTPHQFIIDMSSDQSVVFQQDSNVVGFSIN